MAGEPNGVDAAKPGNARRRKAIVLFLAAALLTVASGTFYWWYRQTHISTDDAYIEGRIHPVAARVQGTVVEVLVEDNQPVKRGDLLLRIDPEPYDVRVDAASSALAASESDRTAARSDIAAAKADLEAARSRVSLAEVSLAQADRDLARARGLFERHSLSRERFERVTTDQEAARARLDLARNELALAEATVGKKEAVAVQQEAKVRQRRSALSEAKLLRGYAEVFAPADGRVTRKSVESGQVISPGQPLLAVTGLSDVWVVANYKETQIEKIRPGQEVRVRVDTFPGKTFRGKVDSIMAGTGSAFSLFPPENATGNYVKVVQRIPVKILLAQGEDPEHILRVGMSVVPTVLVR